MEISLSVDDGKLTLVSAGSVCSAGTLEGPSINFQGSQTMINDALSGLVYLVRRSYVFCFGVLPTWNPPPIAIQTSFLSKLF